MGHGPEFFQTRMGITFFEGTMPRLVKTIEQLNERLAALANSTTATAKELRKECYSCDRSDVALFSHQGKHYVQPLEFCLPCWEQVTGKKLTEDQLGAEMDEAMCAAAAKLEEALEAADRLICQPGDAGNRWHDIHDALIASLEALPQKRIGMPPVDTVPLLTANTTTDKSYAHAGNPCVLCGGTVGRLNEKQEHNLCRARADAGQEIKCLGHRCTKCLGIGQLPKSPVGPQDPTQQAMDAWAPKCDRCDGTCVEPGTKED